MVIKTSQVAVRHRAVTDSLKDARRDVILAAAQDLFCKQVFESISMSTIAASVGLAKGTLYLYFRTREEIFLALLTRELQAWLSSLSAATHEFPAPEDALDWIVDSLADRQDLLRLGALLHSVLERNLSVEAAREFKLTFDAGLSATAGKLAPALHLASQEEARRFLRWLQVSILGLCQMAYPSPVVEAAMAQEPRLAHMVIDFRRELRAMLGVMLTGMRRKEDSNGE
jgi:TetR/AcrR family transcriptional regulator